MAIRGKGEVIMGKNTIMRKVIRDNGEKNPKLLALLPLIRGNMGFIFTNGDLNAIRTQVQEFKLPAAAKPGVVAPIDVIIPPGPTGASILKEIFSCPGDSKQFVRDVLARYPEGAQADKVSRLNLRGGECQ